jgi:sugar phosphate isomerase/epimerase
MDDAAESGAQSITVVSGSRPEDPSARLEALGGLEETMTKIGEAASRRGDLGIVIEPLDYEAHKRATLGSTDEAMELCRRLESAGLELNLCIDTAHLILNEEDVAEAVEKARPRMVDFHFCNAVTDRSHSLFGDRHLPFGSPGVVDVERIAGLMTAFARSGFMSKTGRPRIFCEVMTQDDWAPMQVVAHCEEILEKAWDQASQTVA